MMTAMMGLNDIFISVTPDKNYRRNQNSLNKKRKREAIHFWNSQYAMGLSRISDNVTCNDECIQPHHFQNIYKRK